MEVNPKEEVQSETKTSIRDTIFKLNFLSPIEFLSPIDFCMIKLTVVSDIM